MLPGPGSTNPAALHAEPADDAANSGMAMVLMLAIAMIRHDTFVASKQWLPT